MFGLPPSPGGVDSALHEGLRDIRPADGARCRSPHTERSFPHPVVNPWDYLTLANESILVVDDDAFMRELLQESLTEAGFNVDVAESGKEALHHISVHEYHVALIDLSLEDMSGLEVVDTIIDGSPDTRIMIMTGYPSIQTAIDALRRGAQDYIIKPFKMPEVQAAVARSLRVQKLEAEVRTLRLKVRDQEQEITRLRGNAPGRPVGGSPQAAGRPTALPGAYGAPRAQPPEPEESQ